MRQVKKWKTSEIKFIKENISTMTWSQIAQKLGRKKSAVTSYCYLILKLKKYPDWIITPPWSKEEDETLLNLQHKNSVEELSQLIGRSKYATKNRLYKLRKESKAKKAA